MFSYACSNVTKRIPVKPSLMPKKEEAKMRIVGFTLTQAPNKNFSPFPQNFASSSQRTLASREPNTSSYKSQPTLSKSTHSSRGATPKCMSLPNMGNKSVHHRIEELSSISTESFNLIKIERPKAQSATPVSPWNKLDSSILNIRESPGHENANDSTISLYSDRTPNTPIGSNHNVLDESKLNTKQIPKVSSSNRLNKFVRCLYGMLKAEQDLGVVEWHSGLLIIHSTDAFTKNVLPKYFNTRNFKTFRRQLNYYGFVHVQSFSTKGKTTTALWVNQELAELGTSNITSVLMLKRVEPCRKARKKQAANAVKDIGINSTPVTLQHIRHKEIMDKIQCGGAKLPMYLKANVNESTLQIPRSANALSPNWSKCKTPSPVLMPSYSSTNDAAQLLLMFSNSACSTVL